MQNRFVSLALALAGSTLLAQSFTPVREQKNLSPAAIEKLHTIETLNSLPVGDWRFHVGDLPHGESPTLDDSAWPVVSAPSKAPKDAVWYRREIEVPKTLHGYDITGSRIWFQFRADANGPMPQIIYFNGRRVALGDDLEPIILFEPAKPGDKILVAVKLLHTVDEKSFKGVTLRIEPPDATSANTRPNPDDVRTQCIAAANLLPALPTPRKDLLPKVEEAIAAIDTKALAAGDQIAFDHSLLNSQAILATLHPVLSQANIIEAGNSHIDAAWLWPRSETVDVVRRTFTTALQLMNEYPDYTFTQSAAQYSEWMADKYPELNNQIRQRVKEGRWEIVGGMWVEPDLNIPDGESLVRQLLVGQRYFQKEYGVAARIGWNPDSFGYNWQLPQIYKRSGLDYFVTQKMHWNDTNKLPFRLFWWQSPDGSKVLTYFPTDYVHSNVNPTRISADFAESAHFNPGTTEMLDLYGIGDHGGGPTRAMLDQADHWIARSHNSVIATAQNPVILSEGRSPKSKDLSDGPSQQAPSTLSPANPAAIPAMRYGTAQHYFSDIERNLNPDSPIWNYNSIAKGYTPPPASTSGAIGVPTWNDELYFEYHRGVFTTQAAHKRNNRTSETATLNAEKFASMAWLLSLSQPQNLLPEQRYPAAELTEDWKKITFNQFHDLAAGSGIAVIYRDAQQDYTEVFNSDKLIDDSSFATVTAQINTASLPIKLRKNRVAILRPSQSTPIVVFNPLPWERSEVIPVSVQTSETHTDPSKIEFRDADGLLLFTEVVGIDPNTHVFKALVHATGIPSLGYTVLHVSDGAGTGGRAEVASWEPADSYAIQNSELTVIVDKKTGCISKITAMARTGSSTDYLAPNSCANQLQAFKDTPKQYDAWNIDPGTLGASPTIIDKVDSISVLTDGPLRKTIRIQRTWQSSHFIQDISLDAGADTVRIETNIDWHEKHVLLKAAFPLAATSATATYEIPYGAITRPTTRDNTWEQARFKVPALRWADLGDDHQGVSILNDSKYGYDALGNTLRLTLLRSPTWPDPDADQGPQHFTYAIYPHTGTWKQAQTVHRAYELNSPLTAQQVSPHTGTLPASHSFASVENPNVTLTAIKKAEDSDALVFRMYEWAGTPTDVKLHIPPGALYSVESNLMEKPEGTHLSLSADTVTVPIKPFEILTVLAFYPTKSATTN